ncbi:hypothetical protein HNQ08_005019 [Deinococcus humi]|uniref:Uncharacterized protein n=1 Tax=Deinococcus humi TaxID=662880 RepID=A0A7W8NII6_9DEIO|nr:hypothetical protein [Deinococcus humi]
MLSSPERTARLQFSPINRDLAQQFGVSESTVCAGHVSLWRVGERGGRDTGHRRGCPWMPNLVDSDWTALRIDQAMGLSGGVQLGRTLLS